MNTPRTLAIILLAAGKGTRMQDGELPKMLVSFRGRPLMTWALESIASSGLGVQPLIVVGHAAEHVRAQLGDAYATVMQEEQRGTGDAVKAARDVLKDKSDDVFVLYGDHPLLSGATIRRIVGTHQTGNAVITMATVSVPDFAEWRRPFADFGRIVRDAQGRVVKNVETFQAKPHEITITEVNPSFYCFRGSWLWSHLDLLSDANAKQEFLLTDLVSIAIAQGYALQTVPLADPREALGVNTLDQLRSTESIIPSIGA